MDATTILTNAATADLCIGLLLGGTTILTNAGSVVFDYIIELLVVMQQFRENQQSMPRFGDLSQWASGKEAFRDGNASLRIGQYLRCLLEWFERGLCSTDVIDQANIRYSEEWGSGNIIQWH